MLFCGVKTTADKLGKKGTFPSGQGGITIAIHIAVSNGLDIYTVRVTVTDYTQFAMMYAVVKFENVIYFQTKLNGRSLLHSSRIWPLVTIEKGLVFEIPAILYFKGPSGIGLSSFLSMEKGSGPCSLV